MSRFCFSALLATLLPVFIAAQSPSRTSPLSIPQIMQGERFVGFLPEEVQWHPNSREVLFSWNPEQDTLRSLYRAHLADLQPQPVPLAEQAKLPEQGAYNSDFSQMAYSKDGDLFLYEPKTGGIRQLTNTLAREQDPTFFQDDRYLAYLSDGNLFAWDLEAGQLAQLTDFRKGSEPKTKPADGQQQWLEAQQQELFEIMRLRKGQQQARDARQKALKPTRPKPIYLGEKQQSQLRISPDGRFVTCRLATDVQAKRTQVPNFVTESGYLDIERARAKVGQPEPDYTLGIYDRQRDTFYLAQADSLSGLFDKPEYLVKVYGDTTAVHQSPRALLLHAPVFSDGGRAVLTVRALDNKSRWIAELDLASGALRQIDHQRDEAWIGGPGISSWNQSSGTLGWLDEETVYFQSEATGYAHLYAHHLPSGQRRALTSGDFEVRSVQLSRDKQRFYLTANAEGPHEQHIYHLPAKGGKLQKLTSKPGKHELSVSPDERHLAIRYSYSNQPWELFLMENKLGAAPKQITQSLTPGFQAYEWREPEIVYFPAADGAQVPARLYRPEASEAKGPAVIFVHGAGYLQNAHLWWSSYYREYMFHNFLVDQGYTVLDIDYRGSDGYGRDWRTGIYRHMGGKDLSDQVDGARFLVEEHGIDPARIGIYGGSYGGFITLMGLFTSPGTFRCGAALRSVTDWAHYNHGYTSNILNTPLTDSIAYRQSSPIYFAEGLEDELLILHGMVDDNVQFQDVVRLAQRLIELGKEDWEMAVFPIEPHSFVEPHSWTDEYRRIFRLFEGALWE